MCPRFGAAAAAVGFFLFVLSRSALRYMRTRDGDARETGSDVSLLSALCDG